MPSQTRRVRVKKLEFYQLAVILFILGMIVGICFSRGIHKGYSAQTNQFFQQIQSNLEKEEMEYTLLFQEIVGERLKSVGLLLIFSVSVLGLVYIGGFLIYKGCITGFLIGSILFQFGIKGVLLAVSLFFPHCFFYAPAYFSLLSKGYRLGTKGSSKDELRRELPQIITVLGLFFVGCILEGYGNTWLLKQVFSII